MVRHTSMAAVTISSTLLLDGYTAHSFKGGTALSHLPLCRQHCGLARSESRDAGPRLGGTDSSLNFPARWKEVSSSHHAGRAHLVLAAPLMVASTGTTLCTMPCSQALSILLLLLLSPLALGSGESCAPRLSPI